MRVSSALAVPEKPHHLVQFYEGEDFLSGVVGQYVGAGLTAGESVIVIGTQPHRETLLAHLRGNAIDTGRLTLLDADETLAQIMVEGMPDRERFQSVIGELMQKCTAVGEVRAYGEMVDLLWQRGKASAAVCLEELWNDLREQQPFSLLCTYDLSKFHRDAHGAALLEVCRTHSHVSPTERYTQIEEADDRLREVVQLQQRAQALENEIEQRKQTEHALREALRQRDDFLSIAGHELRTPLTAAQLLVDSLLATGAVGQRAQERLQRSARSIERLSRLVEELLDVSRISAGRLTLDLENFEMGAVMREVLEGAHEDIALSGSPVNLVAGAPVTGNWDRSRVQQVITNLLSNALKYGSGNPIDVRIERCNEVARLMVSDRGIGISAADQERIFNRFERAASTQTGFGLGLWIVKQIVEAHGGTIRVASQEGNGSTFVVELPCNTA